MLKNYSHKCIACTKHGSDLLLDFGKENSDEIEKIYLKKKLSNKINTLGNFISN